MNIDQLSKIIEAMPYNEIIIQDSGAKESAVLLPLIEIEDKLYILFEKRSAFVSQPGEICFPGGRVEKSDASYAQSAIRETREELGFDEEDIHLLGKLGILISHNRNAIHCFVGFIHWQEVYYKRYNKDEVEEILLVDMDTLLSTKPNVYKVRVKALAYEDDEHGNKTEIFPAKELGMPTKYHDEWDMGYRNIVSYDLGNTKIWGITGFLLRHFLDLIKDKKL